MASKIHAFPSRSCVLPPQVWGKVEQQLKGVLLFLVLLGQQRGILIPLVVSQVEDQFSWEDGPRKRTRYIMQICKRSHTSNSNGGWGLRCFKLWWCTTLSIKMAKYKEPVCYSVRVVGLGLGKPVFESLLTHEAQWMVKPSHPLSQPPVLPSCFEHKMEEYTPSWAPWRKDGMKNWLKRAVLGELQLVDFY